jgi:hypothetical protein
LSPGRVKNFLHVVRPNSGAHPAFYPICTGGYSPGVKRPRREADYSLPTSAEVYISTPPYSAVRLSPLGTAATTGLLYQPQMIDDGDCGQIGGMKIGRGNRSTRKKPAPAPLCPPQIPHDQTRARTRAAAVGSQ